MRTFKRYVLRDTQTKQIVDTIIIEVGKHRPPVKQGLYIAECIGKYEKETEDKTNVD